MSNGFVCSWNSWHPRIPFLERSLGSFPQGYDRNAQVVVYLAIQQLLAEGSTGFDTLIEHFNDKRYSYTYAAPDGEYNRTVGEACGLIMMRCIKCYHNEIHIITEEQFRLAPDFSKEKYSRLVETQPTPPPVGNSG